MKIGDLVTIKPAKTGTYLIVGERFIGDHVDSNVGRRSQGSDTYTIDCWMLLSAGEGWVMPMGKMWCEVIK